MLMAAGPQLCSPGGSPCPSWSSRSRGRWGGGGGDAVQACVLGPWWELVFCQGCMRSSLFRTCLNTAQDKGMETLPISAQAATLFPQRCGAGQARVRAPRLEERPPAGPPRPFPSEGRSRPVATYHPYTPPPKPIQGGGSGEPPQRAEGAGEAA